MLYEIQHYKLPIELQPKNLSHYHQVGDDIARHLRDRNYSIADIFAKFVIVKNSHNFDQENTSWK